MWFLDLLGHPVIFVVAKFSIRLFHEVKLRSAVENIDSDLLCTLELKPKCLNKQNSYIQ